MSRDPVKVKANNLRYRARHREKVLAIQARYDVEHKTEKVEYDRQYRQVNQERIAEQTSAWKHEHPDRVRFHSQQYRSRKLLANGSHSLQEWEGLKAQYDYKCFYCGIMKELGEDHVQPLSRGGSDYIENIVPCCWECNRLKRNKTGEEFASMTQRQRSSLLS